jgi:hypothetical protein
MVVDVTYLDKNAVKVVRFILIGMVRGVLVVAID